MISAAHADLRRTVFWTAYIVDQFVIPSPLHVLMYIAFLTIL
jgi:hypothetical protein